MQGGGGCDGGACVFVFEYRDGVKVGYREFRSFSLELVGWRIYFGIGKYNQFWVSWV